MTAVFRAEVAGSLLRPEYLKEAHQRLARGQLAAADLRVIEDRAVDEAIALQQKAGLDVITDGEMRRRDFMAPLYEEVEGVEPFGGRPLTWTHVATAKKMSWPIPFRVTGKVRRNTSPVADGYAYARDHARSPVKQTLPSPLLMNWAWRAEGLDGIYNDPFELLADATTVIREHARELARLGCDYIQIDAPDIAGLADPARGEVHPASGIPVARLLTDGLDLLNAIPAGIADVTFALHLCRGNIRSHYSASGGYERISRQVFTRLTNYHVFLLEYDDERSGDFAPLTDCPCNKIIVLGLISSKTGQLEDPASVMARIEQATRYYPLEQLALSTQCGFATELEGNHITFHQQQAKLALVAALGRQIWP
jgi:5-methyltetrahydropteroyltriglutamate--homocysteine methyltransferase